MQQMINRFLWLLLLASGLQSGWAYSLGGPIGNGGPVGDEWQNQAIGYGLPGDINAPKNWGEEYRRNTPVMYYAYDQNFLDYFGSNGVAAVDSAFAVFNSLTNVDSYSQALNEFPFESRHQNYQAQALGLLDLKTFTIGAIVEQLGLTDPIRYNWTLHTRFLPAGGVCPPDEEYLIVERNFDPPIGSLTTVPYTPYVNNTLYSYVIQEICSGPNPLSLAVPFSVDPLADTASPVASLGNIFWGDYYTGLTRDDVGGLRYLLSTNNINFELPSPDSTLIVGITNFTTQQLFPVATGTNSGYLFSDGVRYGTGSLNALLGFASTNNAAAVQAAFPGIQVNQISAYFTNILVTNVVSYFTNYNGSPAGTLILVTITNVTPGIGEFYVDTFPNIITNSYSSNTTYYLQTITVGPPNGAPAGSPSITNTVSQTVTVHVPSGDFYILPTNGPCGVDILSTILTVTNFTTNIITSAITNSTSTNAVLGTTLVQVIPNVSHIFNIYPINCEQVVNATNLYEGIGKVSFVRADFDSLLGQYWQPVTNKYAMVLVTNSQATTVNFQRIVTEPDILLSAQDIAAPNPPAIDVANGDYVRNINFNQSTILQNLAGPGTIVSPTTIAFNKVGPVYFNVFGGFADGTPYFTENPGNDLLDPFYAEYVAWGTFDGTTNAPTVYPNGTSVLNLVNEVLIKVSPTTLSGGFSGVPYTAVTFTATGGSFTPPYTWSATGLPDGMTMSSGGILSGTPTTSGTYDSTVILTDYVGKTVQWTYTITIQ
jgi:hypothetical protein